MPSVTDFLGGKSTEAAGSAVDALEDVGKAAEGLGKVFTKSVGAPLRALEAQLKQNIKDIDKARRRGAISAREATAQTKSMNDALERVNKTAEEVAKGNVTGAKAAKALNKEITRSNKLLKEENKLTRARLKGETALFQSMKQRGKRAVEAARFELKPGRLATGESKVVKGAGAAGQKFADVLPGSQGLGPSGFGGGAMGALGATPWGAVLGAILKVGSAVANKNREAAIAVTQRFLNYGIKSQTGLAGQVDQVKDAFVKAGEATLKFNGDLEATQSVMTQIWTQTGAEVKDVGNSIALLEEMRFIGLGSIDELADNAIKRMNQTGMSFHDAAMEMKALALQAQALSFEGGENVVQMDDFYKGVQELSEGIESMNVNQIALGKSFSTNLKIGKKLGLTYERNIAAAKGLTRALTDNYDEGFATLEVNEDLAAAMQSKTATGELTQVAKDAAKIAEDLDRGFITQDRAAEMLKEIGGTTDERVIQERIRRAAESGTVLPMLEARLGKLTFDQLQVFKDIQARVSAGEDLSKILPTLSAKDRETYKSAVDKAAEKQLDPAKAANLLLDKILVTLSEVLPDMLSALTTTLKGIGTAVEWIGKKLGWDEAGRKKAAAAESTALETTGGKDILLRKIKTNIGMAATSMSNEELMERFAADKGLRAKVGSLTESMKAGLTEELGAEKGTQVFQLAEAETKIRKRERAKAKQSLEGEEEVVESRTGANGTGEDLVRRKDPNRAREAVKMSNRIKNTTVVMGPQPPIR